jgi:hypothetical protein
MGHAGLRAVLKLLRRCGVAAEFRLPLDCLVLDHPLVRELMKLWSRLHWASIDGMMPPDELIRIVELAYAGDADGDTVELGSWVGLTTCYLAAACQARGRGEVFTVDTFVGTKEGGQTYPSSSKYGGSTLAAFEHNVAASGLGHRIHVYVGRTTEMAKRHAGRPIRLLFIDADHSYAGVKADFDTWSPLVMAGGLIIFHDYRINDVRRFIERELRQADGIDPCPGLIHPNLFVATSSATPSVSSERTRSGDHEPAECVSSAAWIGTSHCAR